MVLNIRDYTLLSNSSSKGQRWLLENIPKATKHDCLVYPYSKGELGYGFVAGYGNGAYKLVHRVVYYSVFLVEPDVVMHTCATPSCCNPYHLQAGTRATNNADRASKGRSATKVYSRRRLTAEQVATIKSRWVPGKGPHRNPNGTSALAKEFGVDAAVIVKIIKGTYCVISNP